MVSFQKKEMVFAQGDDMDGLFFIQTGKIRLSVVSDDGREAVLGILGVGDFFGEGGRWSASTHVVRDGTDRLRLAQC